MICEKDATVVATKYLNKDDLDTVERCIFDDIIYV